MTVGMGGGDAWEDVSSVGIDCEAWDEDTRLDVEAPPLGGSVFWLSPADGPGGADPIVLAQLTVPAESAGIVTMGVQGLSMDGEDYHGGVQFKKGGVDAPPPTALPAEVAYLSVNGLALVDTMTSSVDYYTPMRLCLTNTDGPLNTYAHYSNASPMISTPPAYHAPSPR